MQKFLESSRSGAVKGWNGFVWLLKIMIPVSLFTLLLEYSGVLQYADPIVAPVMHLMGLPASAALPILSSAFAGIYAGIASMAVLSFSIGQMTLIAIFMLICHNLIQEGIIQGKSGLHPVKAIGFRVTVGFLTVMLCARFLPHAAGGIAGPSGITAVQHDFWAMMMEWTQKTAYLSLKMLVIIVMLMTVLELLKAFGLVDRLIRLATPVLVLIGLRPAVATLWLTAVFFGISYGAAVIIQEAKEKEILKEDLEKLHLSIGINHSIIEDPVLFIALGISPFWLWVPRLAAAVVTVYLVTFFQNLRRNRKAAGTV